jgi:hypothetical protein
LQAGSVAVRLAARRTAASRLARGIAEDREDITDFVISQWCIFAGRAYLWQAKPAGDDRDTTPSPVVVKKSRLLLILNNLFTS